MLLVSGLALLLTAVILILILLLIPGQARIPLERRRPHGDDSTSSVSRFAGTTTAALERYLSSRDLKLYSKESLELAGLRVSQAEYILLVLAAGLVLALMGLVAGGPVLAMVFFLLAPPGGILFLSYRTAKRRANFDQQLGDTLQLLTGSLRAGHSILRAIEAAAIESASPTAEEMRRVVAETSLGKDLLAALNDTATRMTNEDFVWIAQAIQINREVGGNLAEVLDQVGETIRERSEIKGQIKALAAEGKFSAYILMGLPIGIILILLVVSPGYMDPMFEHPLGWGMMALSGILMTVGGLWLRKIIDLKF